jgi:hypothetical protein
MTTVPDALITAQAAGRLLTACDVSPPRGPTLDLEPLRALRADFLCCAYLPGRAVRLDSVAMAYMLKRHLSGGPGGGDPAVRGSGAGTSGDLTVQAAHDNAPNSTGPDVIFNLATRDMNRLALSTHLLGAAALGLENAVALRGDDFPARDLNRVRPVHDTSPSELIALATELNEGRDFRDAELAAPVPICMGATMDFSRDFTREVRLAVRKARAGARFFLTQSIYDATLPERFREAFRAASGNGLAAPVLWGVPVLASGGITFGDVPNDWRRDLDAGRPGAEIALDFLGELRRRGVEAAYLIPPILRGGARDYAAAARVLADISS